jgi:hypothetical protein
MSNRIVLGFAAAAFAALACKHAQGELIELTNGQVLQGDVREGQTTEEGLAVNVYDTGGVVVVRWDHIVASQRKEFRLKLGIDLPDETVELVPGHRVQLISGEKVEGLALNPRVLSEPLKMKTRTGVKEYDRASLAGPVEDAQIDGLIIYTVEELYQKIHDESSLDTPAAHKLLATRCMNFGAYDHAKEHLLAAKASDVFMATDEGKAVESMLRVCDLMIRAKGASDLVTQIRQAMSGSRWNDALKLFNQLDKDYKDEAIRKAVNYDLLETRVTKGRNDYFQKEISREVFKVLNQLIDKKAREKKPSRDAADDPNAKPGATTPGTLAAAKQWETRDLQQQLWDTVAQHLDLKQDEIDKFWKARSDKRIHKDSYATGSFIVVTRSSGTKAGAPPPPPQRRPPGADNSKKKSGSGKSNAPKVPDKVEKPLTEEEWWDSVQSGEKASWLMANFVERSGYFEILGTPQVNCDGCGGTGFTKSTGANGEDEQHFCKTCNGCGLVRSVNYR